MPLVSGARQQTSAGTTLTRVSPNKPPMRRRTFYCSDELWDEVMEIAAEEGENVADIIRDGLERYRRKKRKRK